MRSADNTSKLEHTILRALCRHTIQPAEWTELNRKLARYVWREPDHAVAYQAILSAHRLDSKDWRAHLPAQTTRMGFPDLDWKVFLEPATGDALEPDVTDIRQLIQLLKNSGDQSG